MLTKERKEDLAIKLAPYWFVLGTDIYWVTEDGGGRKTMNYLSTDCTKNHQVPIMK